MKIKLFPNFSDEQRMTFEKIRDGQNVIICGVPGSGKTSFALNVAKQFPDQKILFLTFNRELRFIIRQIAAENGIQNTTIFTYNGYFNQFFNHDTSHWNDLDLLQNYSEFKQTNNFDIPFSMVILDEFQDATVTTLLYLKHLLKAQQIIVMGDLDGTVNFYRQADARFLKYFQRWWPERNFFQTKWLKSWRIPANLADTINFLLPQCQKITGLNSKQCAITYLANVQVENIENPKNNFYFSKQEHARDCQFFDGYQQNLATIQKWFLEQTIHYSLNEIALIVPSPGMSPLLAEIKRFFNQNNWPFSEPNDLKKHFRLGDKKIRILTPQMAKGMSFSCVAVFGFSRMWFKHRTMIRQDSNLWIALTRGSERLMIIETNDLSGENPRLPWIASGETLSQSMTKLGVQYHNYGPETWMTYKTNVVNKPELKIDDHTFRHIYLSPSDWKHVNQVFTDYEIVTRLQDADQNLATHLVDLIGTKMAFQNNHGYPEFNQNHASKIFVHTTPLNATFFMAELLDSIFTNWYKQIYDDLPNLINQLPNHLKNGSVFWKATLFASCLYEDVKKQKNLLDNSTKLRLLSLFRWVKSNGQFNLFNEIAWDDYHWLDRLGGLNPLILRAQISLTLDEEGDFFLFPRFQIKINDSEMKQFSSMLNLPPLQDLSIVMSNDFVKQNRLYDFLAIEAEIGWNAKLKMLFNLFALNEFHFKDWYDDPILTEKPRYGYLYNLVTGEFCQITYHRRAAIEVFKALFGGMLHHEAPVEQNDDQFISQIEHILGTNSLDWLNNFRNNFFS